MGNWAVISQYESNDAYITKVICRGRETKAHALEELRAVLHTYLPNKNIVEQWRHVYRFADQESYLVVIKGMMSTWQCTLRIAELISDSTDPAVAERAQLEGGAAEVADGPQDRIPPGG
ncbi:hypothetical protein [Streptomyces sp. NBC_00038]|uniref:hypothetical protein n=1 Tax=Streptomyces sp. NBC_00038 TaxID=2903615 RepID=UPI00224EF941|nr:hypothetical protein [Streptomyces sp. NBC_00038]MCX5558070.1 hypothetical protein [Streptomyces sp. NBC_00038]